MRPTYLLAFSLILPACGDDERRGNIDAGEDPDAEIEPDAAPPDADTPLPEPEAVGVPLSATGADGFFNVAFAGDGSFYAAGYTTVVGTDRAFVVAKFRNAGTLDTSFGDAGIATVNVAVGGGTAETARAIAVDSTGKIVVGGIIEHDVLAVPPANADRDMAVVRLEADGDPDPTFDTDGILILDRRTGFDNGGTWVGADDFRGLALDGSDRIYVHGTQLTDEDPGNGRTDNDWVVVRLTTAGVVDDGWANDGEHRLDILDGHANARSVEVLADGSVIGTGYSNTTAFNSTQPVVYKVLPDGSGLDTSFGTGGFFHEAVLLSVTEVYGIAPQGDKWITAGYGRDTSTEPNDWAPLRLNADGTLDTTWGDSGLVRIDFHTFGDNNRELCALPGDRAMLVGHAQTESGIANGQIVVLEGDGVEDTTFSTDGRFAHDLGGPSDGYWHCAVSPDESIAIAVGMKGFGSTQTPTDNDDAAIVIVALE
jgi:uncharacterized delta-60 repeat protein